jgi:hypothetical protein
MPGFQLCCGRGTARSHCQACRIGGSVGLAQQLYAALPAANRIQVSDVNAVMNRFVNAVGAELGMDEFVPLKVKLEDLEQRISDAVDPRSPKLRANGVQASKIVRAVD